MEHGEEDVAQAAAVRDPSQALQAEHDLCMLLAVVCCDQRLWRMLHAFLCCSVHCGEHMSLQCVLRCHDRACCADWLVFHCLWVLLGPYRVVAAVRDP